MTNIKPSGAEYLGHVEVVKNVLALTESSFEAFEAEANHTREWTCGSCLTSTWYELN